MSLGTRSLGLFDRRRKRLLGRTVEILAIEKVRPIPNNTRLALAVFPIPRPVQMRPIMRPPRHLQRIGRIRRRRIRVRHDRHVDQFTQDGVL